MAASAASMASASIISMAAGRMPAAMIPDTASPAWSVDGKAARKVRVASGLRSRRTVTSVTMPSVPSEPTTRAEQVVAGRVGRVAAQLHDVAAVGHEPRRQRRGWS